MLNGENLEKCEASVLADEGFRLFASSAPPALAGIMERCENLCSVTSWETKHRQTAHSTGGFLTPSHTLQPCWESQAEISRAPAAGTERPGANKARGGFYAGSFWLALGVSRNLALPPCCQSGGDLGNEGMGSDCLVSRCGSWSC